MTGTAVGSCVGTFVGLNVRMCVDGLNVGVAVVGMEVGGFIFWGVL